MSEPRAREKLLSAEDLGPDPIRAFERWFEDARARSKVTFPNAFCLSTVDSRGWPESRIVLLKGFDERGFVFFTNYRSRKGRAIESCPRAALTFYWHDRERQIRITGSVERVEPAESDAYFRSRPRGSRIGAWASRQSEPSVSRADLERRLHEIEKRYPGEEVPRPPHWGGYRVRPVEIEFWQGAPDRLHDRMRYERDSGGSWRIQRIDP